MDMLSAKIQAEACRLLIGTGRNVNTDALSMVGLYFIPVCASLKGAERFALMTEDLGSTNITHS